MGQVHTVHHREIAVREARVLVQVQVNTIQMGEEDHPDQPRGITVFLEATRPARISEPTAKDLPKGTRRFKSPWYEWSYQDYKNQWANYTLGCPTTRLQRLGDPDVRGRVFDV